MDDKQQQEQLAFATLDELVEEIVKRSEAMVLMVTLKSDQRAPNQQTIGTSYWNGNFYTCMGMVSALRRKLWKDKDATERTNT